MLETDVENAAVTWAEARGWLTLKMTPTAQKGWPDRLFVWTCGIHVWIEFKKPGETPRKLQAYRIKQLRKRAVGAHWTDNLEEAKKLLMFYEV